MASTSVSYMVCVLAATNNLLAPEIAKNSRAVCTDILHFSGELSSWARSIVSRWPTADPLRALLNDGHPRADDQAMAAARPQQRYDHRLRELVHRTGDPTIATDLGVPQSTARGWLRTAPTVVIGLDVPDLSEHELRQEVLKLHRRVEKLAALLRLALVLLSVSKFTLAGERVGGACSYD